MLSPLFFSKLCFLLISVHIRAGKKINKCLLFSKLCFLLISVHIRAGKKINKCLLFSNRKCVSLIFLPVVALFNFSHHSIRGINTDISIPHRHRKNGVQNGIYILDTVGFKTSLPNKRNIKFLYVTVFY